ASAARLHAAAQRGEQRRRGHGRSAPRARRRRGGEERRRQDPRGRRCRARPCGTRRAASRHNSIVRNATLFLPVLFLAATAEAVDGDEPLTVILRPPIQRKVTVEGGGAPVANALVVFGPHLMARTSAAGEAPMLDESIATAIASDRAVSVRPAPRIASLMK